MHIFLAVLSILFFIGSFLTPGFPSYIVLLTSMLLLVGAVLTEKLTALTRKLP